MCTLKPSAKADAAARVPLSPLSQALVFFQMYPALLGAVFLIIFPILSTAPEAHGADALRLSVLFADAISLVFTYLGLWYTSMELGISMQLLGIVGGVFSFAGVASAFRLLADKAPTAAWAVGLAGASLSLLAMALSFVLGIRQVDDACQQKH